MAELGTHPTSRILVLDVQRGYENSADEEGWFRVTWTLHSKTRKVSYDDLQELIAYLIAKRDEKQRRR